MIKQVIQRMSKEEGEDLSDTIMMEPLHLFQEQGLYMQLYLERLEEQSLLNP